MRILLCVFVVYLSGWSCLAQEGMTDTREGEDISLKCRFNGQLPSTVSDTLYYWLRTNKHNQDNVAIKSTPLEGNYKLDFRPELGIYDLLISNSTYERDNGKFECRLKEAGTGREIHSQSFQITVLTPPSPPRISPGTNPVATEGRALELSCTSSGGSPEPIVRWYREGVRDPLESVTRSGTSAKESITSAVLQVTPSREDDGAVYRCVVWNRAMVEGTKFETRTTLSVNYYPRVQIGPENPLRVERDESITLQCNVDAKPRVNNVRWMRDDRFIATSFTHVIQKVTTQDAGTYTCMADNGLGQTREAELVLDVQYPPMVTVDAGPGAARQREAEEGDGITIQCNVSANPAPISVEWIRDGRPDFRQSGDVLRIPKVTADSGGVYTCRAINILYTSSLSRQRINRIGNASLTLLVRHRPGVARITPDRPVATEGTGVTLTCSASPPGWPTPQYKWWREFDSADPSTSATILSTGPKYTIPSVHLGSEGRYRCQAINEMGPGDASSVLLTVHHAPKFVTKLQPHVTRRASDIGFSAICAAQGKPKPAVTWFKDGKEVLPDWFDVSTDETDNSNGVTTVHSTLKFHGKERPRGNQLVPSDRGVYSCAFENDVKKVESSMLLRIEHEPIVLHQFNKVASDLYETAEVICRVQSYPRPEFQWSYNNHMAPLLAGSDGHYEINTTINESGGDIYTSVLQVSNLRETDYGDYSCRVANTLGSVKPTIKLQPKGPPDHPENVTAFDIGHNNVVLQWNSGFNGGVLSTKHFVSYKKVSVDENEFDSDCYSVKRSNQPERWQEFDCQTKNPCNVTNLEQHQSYLFKVKAYNAKGHSEYSQETVAMTKVDRIPAPQRVTFDPKSHALTINIGATCLQLVGVVEASMGGAREDWHLIETLPLAVSGSTSTHREATILSLVSRRQSTGARSLDDDDDLNLISGSEDEDLIDKPVDDVRIRVRLCLRSSQTTCGDYTEAEIGANFVKEQQAMATPTLIALVISCAVFILFVALLFIFCRCKRKTAKKTTGKEYEMDSSTVHPSIIHGPPPYTEPGLDNKALQQSVDLVHDVTKNGVYGSQNDYNTYHTGNGLRPNGVNVGYVENSYSNSNNGGSVNSQDSLWQLKMGGNGSTGGTQISRDDHLHMAERMNHYGGYDPLTHGGYGNMDDYAHYPQLTSASPDYSTHSHVPSRQDYIHSGHLQPADKTRRRDPHLESPYGDVSGLPDPYLEQLIDNEEHMKPQPHLSMSYDENLESGYSTPNSRTRRIIREIIV
ncbi:hemicentin-2 isoform X2 [Melanaphis sacchari]|uniref:hemicentin-2 isoform X2 n=1 Tax=Melanaphis sacchari TaxID=742174 RepID=UPI000DC15A66|nr:hemicentin-2 isoform X2 [Melanaphis sacchari]